MLLLFYRFFLPNLENAKLGVKRNTFFRVINIREHMLSISCLFAHAVTHMNGLAQHGNADSLRYIGKGI